MLNRILIGCRCSAVLGDYAGLLFVDGPAAGFCWVSSFLAHWGFEWIVGSSEGTVSICWTCQGIWLVVFMLTMSRGIDHDIESADSTEK